MNVVFFLPKLNIDTTGGRIRGGFGDTHVFWGVTLYLYFIVEWQYPRHMYGWPGPFVDAVSGVLVIWYTRTFQT